MFDDSFEHEVWHHGEADRIVLIVDFIHPQLAGVPAYVVNGRSASTLCVFAVAVGGGSVCLAWLGSFGGRRGKKSKRR